MHNNETHLLVCTVPWSYMTMKWMTVLVFFFVAFFAQNVASWLTG